jgi:hypothetical protein
MLENQEFVISGFFYILAAFIFISVLIYSGRHGTRKIDVVQEDEVDVTRELHKIQIAHANMTEMLDVLRLKLKKAKHIVV